ncbi:hypothetical protein [Serpentinicella alkaliphila]|uniref:Uncharacterized protein n=1 Tax=Serpentinicella alkaliphila TaxID=1734049 RepID=A0A4R2TTH2_9FIRM|nr:hypothetical protein [Serpentinicella alkaliphila]QUH25260.1 hypothetical protein HZR23_05430 [Serpentinicella alkaliphila]TCQ07071.1 hypothetical protein EDD79_100267 [Serpentinicella alkaliphila]
MNSLITNIKTTVKKLSLNNPKREVEIIEKLIENLSLYKQEVIKSGGFNSKSEGKLNYHGLKIDKISDEVFLYKPVTTKNYYDDDYLEKFSEIRTSDLSYSGVLEIHNKFWGAHEIMSGNIFATTPLELIDSSQCKKLQKLNWELINADIYEVKADSSISKLALLNAIEKMFRSYLLVREVSGNILMVIEFKK